MWVSNDVADLLSVLDIFPEEMAQLGLWFNRVKRVQGTCYLISNWSEKNVDQWVTIRSEEKYAAWFNPMSGQITKAHIEKTGERESRVYIQLNRGETAILQAYSYPLHLKELPHYKEPASKTALEGEWQVDFVTGGPVLPASYKTTELGSWTTQSDELKKFSGTASYRTKFKKTAGATAWELDLGKVCSSATVLLNGERLGTLVGPTWKLTIEAGRLKDTNELEVRVTNLMANRIIDMDRGGVNYKKFYNVNFAPYSR